MYYDEKETYASSGPAMTRRAISYYMNVSVNWKLIGWLTYTCKQTKSALNSPGQGSLYSSHLCIVG